MKSLCPQCGRPCGEQQGRIVSSDGALLDNRDGFYDHVPDPLRRYDSRTHVALPRERVEALLRLELEWGDFEKPPVEPRDAA